ncbi:DNA repair protein RecN [Candidatus Kinetoplastidibacterium crithidiae]|uniref:DNA repair protein RecN n=1 Tax=Candidatus Kinetoplastidibacterium crithidiae TCC036E TaxID=1208918 RepID=M1M6V6_9PROT|nr:DNA repair protein RecN [Candidatus Kinetoplastibacterium crithidii]AFZ82528.1 DNA repair protein RecN [Candidatus Kinetoplastibacterium crithidii (ex Angomonas deanei ATCC 30255)]AGF47810.1 DNA repair protein RecN [Candidatus Kinetoplastibacterium crithidii TCC036E]
MIRNLFIQNFIIVKNAEIIFSNGFTVFSGETGAGKSIIIDALSFVLGFKVSNIDNIIGKNTINTEVTASFDITTNAKEWLEKHAFSIGHEIHLKRTLDKDNNSKAFINNTPTTIANLRTIGSMLVKIYGQHAYQDLLNTNSQRSLLDLYGQLDIPLTRTKKFWKVWRSIRKDLDNATQLAENLKEELNILRLQAEEISEIKFSTDEWQKIQHEYNKLSNIETIIDTCDFLLKNLDGEEFSIYRTLNTLIQRIDNILLKDPGLQNIYEELNSAQITIKEAIHDLNNYISKIEIDSNKIDDLEARMTLITDTARRLKISPNELKHFHDTIINRINAIKNITNIDEIKIKEQEAQKNYLHAANILSEERSRKATILSNEVTKIMKELSMEDSSFDIKITRSKEHNHGIDNIEFLVSHTGTESKGISKIASGGELSRIYLAISVVTNHSNVPTIIFDEVDSGIGGAVAETIGKLLSQLSNHNQVLCVTHLPQVASYGKNHFLVSKHQKNQDITSEIKELSYDDRVTEIARMLGGIVITPTTIHHAKEMLINTIKNFSNI